MTFDEKSMELFFYYEKTPSEEEMEISEEVVSRVVSSLSEIISVNIHRVVLSVAEKIPQSDFIVFHRMELKFEES